jgi:mycothiol synthase
MRRPHLEGLPPLDLPARYSLRTYLSGDDAAWAEIMNTGISTGWTAERCRQQLTSMPQFRPERLFFAVVANDPSSEPVGSACAWTPDAGETNRGYVHMVCVRPEHRGYHLGYWLTLATLHCFRDNGFQTVILNTDDYRLPAIHEYLQLGFEPELTHPNHGERWDRVFEALKQARERTDQR